MAESTYTVTGMTCGHCVSSVTEEISQIGGVQKVDVELASGKVTVISDQPVAEDNVRAAVTEAGYTLVAS
ncbi:copper ion binding protein [Lentzea waywayandensis]|uniref:Copper ion binding protein n=1 Tax=Lentzea waywayandensis TaxID=84724 RepID=A0A1I6F4S6_9PSEU|nr:heavy-metal-associated domain-containing protein [Lentzea waywayandensis]SFR24852.1 copper ion binding protein [Lentzea waywayandensis]